MLYSYAANQAWADAVRKAGSPDADKLAAAIRGATFDTAIGTPSFKEKGGVKNPAYVWYVWKDGKYGKYGEMLSLIVGQPSS